MHGGFGSTRRLERFAQRATAWTERWMPDAFVFALGATWIVFAAAYAVDPRIRSAPLGLVDAWGAGFWSLIPFTLQMAMLIVGGYVLASSPPIRRLVDALASIPQSPKAAVLVVALAAMISSLVNWGFSLIFGAVLARAIARRVPNVDYRALGASAFLGLGTVWAQGLSGSAALQMARASSMPPKLAQIVGEIPLTDTIFRWQSLVCVAVEIAVVAAALWVVTPSSAPDKTAASVGIDLEPELDQSTHPPATPGERLERSPFMLVPIALLAFAYLARTVSKASTVSDALNALDFNNVNLLFLALGALLHWTPASLMRAVKEGTTATWGVLLQFPFYGGIFGVMTATALSERMAHVFVSASSAATYPAMILTYSGVLGMFVPSGGAKWMIEAPYVLQSAQLLHVSQGWMVIAYNLGEAIANLLQPFWMLPVLALLGLRARDIMGYTYLIAIVLFPVALALITLLAP